MCEIGLATNLDACLQSQTPPNDVYGWCYIDATTDPVIGNPALVADCDRKRQLRFVGDDTPANGSTVFMACMGAPLTTSP